MLGPVSSIPVGEGISADLYLLRFDNDGRLQSPQTAALAIKAAKSGTDVFLFSHGWNNVYEDALTGYCEFADGFIMQRRQRGLPVPPGYRPVLIGVIWPSTSFVLPGEQGPDIAGGGLGGQLLERMMVEVTESMAPEPANELIELLDGSSSLGRVEAEAAAELVREALWPERDEEGASEPPDTATMLASWMALAEAEKPYADEEEQVGTVGAVGVNQPMKDVAETSGPATAGFLNFDPRGILRLGSVWKMKQRAGEVGTYGVGPILAELLKRDTRARLHLVGHSFGARVLLSAVASQQHERRVHSMLLLQPAVNRWCFASDVAGTGKPGGYRVVLDRVQNPILTTLSMHDQPLHEFFHLAVRGDSLGEIDIAAFGDTDRYGALGGYGPNGLGTELIRETLRKPGETYDLSGPARVVSVDGSGAPTISGHGDINNPATWWALHCLTNAEH